MDCKELAKSLGLMEGKVVKAHRDFTSKYQGNISKENVIMELGSNDRMAGAMFDIFDDDNDDFLNFDEFMFLKHLSRDYSLRAKLEIIFNMFDIKKERTLDR